MKPWLIALLLLLGSVGSAASQTQSYWYIGDDMTQVWSLVADNVVPITDTTFKAWLDTPDHIPGRIGSTSELYQVISTSYPAHLPASAPNLEALGGLTPQQAFMWRRDKGLTIIYTGQPTLNGRYGIDDPVLNALMTAALLRCATKTFVDCPNAFPHGESTYPYPDKDLQTHTMNLVQMQTIALAIEDYISDLYQQTLVGINGGTPLWPTGSVTVP